MRVEILAEAEADLLDGYRFYESQEVGVGAYFLDSLLADLESLRLYAGMRSTSGTTVSWRSVSPTRSTTASKRLSYGSMRCLTAAAIPSEPATAWAERSYHP